jgi:hypothetical protein
LGQRKSDIFLRGAPEASGPHHFAVRISAARLASPKRPPHPPTFDTPAGWAKAHLRRAHLRGCLAWAHDYNPDRNIAATFQALPGASFVVNGAGQASDSALTTTTSAELKWINGWSAAATFEGEFSNVTRSYAGRGVVR